jgi:hypothetical protein
LSVEASGDIYYSSEGNLFDNKGNAMDLDEIGFILDRERKGVIRDLGSREYLAYRVDPLSDDLSGVDYDVVQKAEKVGSKSIFEKYRGRCKTHQRMFDSKAQYLFDENLHSLSKNLI